MKNVSGTCAEKQGCAPVPHGAAVEFGDQVRQAARTQLGRPVRQQRLRRHHQCAPALSGRVVQQMSLM